MTGNSQKSTATIILDLLRNLLIILATAYATVEIWQWNRIVAVIAVIPIYILMLNLFGFLTLPLYLLTPETRRTREMEKALFTPRKD